MSIADWRRERISKPVLGFFRKVMPPISDTEQEALEAGDIWWDAELFSGDPDWSMLFGTPAPTLSEDERQFMAGPVETLCRMLDDWAINWEHQNLPPEVWQFIREQGFFGMIIPKEYGGLGFSAYAHSEIVRYISTRSTTAAVTIMVPNSLGPGELLMQFGTQEQRDHYLPRLARGEDIPCFGLTSPEAGSDAASMTDTGVICRGMFDGEEVLGIRLNWHKRYITLSPIATLLGLAFKLYDPDGLLGEQEELGITLALVPTHLPGVEVGERHIPCHQMFLNGPTRGHDVFVPLDYIIGGREQVGRGWRMLMSALAAGRGISLPSQSAAAAALAARTTGAYARVREQFNIPIGQFEGVQYRLARLAATAYTLDAGRRLTSAGLDGGRKLSVISAIMKAHATQRMRESVNDAMDVHAGKAVIDGPSNYLGNAYRAVPVGITVEGANILTRNLIIFGQGAIRCHPWLLREMEAVQIEDEERALAEFDQALWGHIGHAVASFGRAWLRSWSGGFLSPTPKRGPLAAHYRALNRYSASFAFCADMALATLGGSLKRREMLSARFGDVLSELYLLSAVLKRWHDEGEHWADLPLVNYIMATGCHTIQKAFAEIFVNLPNRPAAWLMKLICQPLGVTQHGPTDELVVECAELLLSDNPSRDRITADLCLGYDDDAIQTLEKAFRLVQDTAPAHRKLRKERCGSIDEGVERGLITAEEAEQLREAQEMVTAACAVDSFSAEEFSGQRSAAPAENSFSQGSP